MMSSILDIRAPSLRRRAFFLAPAASRAVNIPLPVEGSTLNLTVFVQTQALLNENGSPDGQSPSYDVFVRRSRVQVNGDIGKSFSYYFQVDNTNFGKFGNFSGRLIVQDAWVGWAPTGNTGPTVLYLEGGIIYLSSGPLPRSVGRALQQFAEFLLPPLRLHGGSVPSRIGAAGDEKDAPVLHSLDLPVEHTELWRIALVIRRVDHEHCRLDTLQAG